jgi:hypothetical protein
VKLRERAVNSERLDATRSLAAQAIEGIVLDYTMALVGKSCFPQRLHGPTAKLIEHAFGHHDPEGRRSTFMTMQLHGAQLKR